MAEHGQSEEVDLDKTDRLPILEGTQYDEDVEDDAIRLEYSGTSPRTPPTPVEFVRPPGIDLPSLAESVRSVEERIARQNAEFQALSHSFERAKDAESAATARASALTADLSAARSALEAEQARVREADRSLAERTAAIESARSRMEDALRESERYQSEARTLRDSLAARDATIVQVLHSLGERDAQLAALQQEHARIVPALEARARSTSLLEAELITARSQAGAMALEIKSTQEKLAAARAQVERGEYQARTLEAELSGTRAQATSHLELLRSREWRRGFDENLFREIDARAGAADAGRGMLQAERDELQKRVAGFEKRIASQDAVIHQLEAAANANSMQHSQKIRDLEVSERAKAALVAQLESADAERVRLVTEIALRDLSLREGRAASARLAEKVKELTTDAERRHSEYTAQIALLKADAETHEDEMSVLMAHLQEARRPIQSIEGDVRRLTEEVAAKAAAAELLGEENRKLRATLERTRGALEEREFLIRRLERSETNNANALGRIQTSMERLGGNAAQNPPPASEIAAELVRLGAEPRTRHALSRRTRIGRAPGCELQIDSSSVSRHHALILLGPREAIIEDLNSTNGVVVNGRRVSRQLLSSGDSVTIGDVQFQFQSHAKAGGAAEPNPVAQGPTAP